VDSAVEGPAVESSILVIPSAARKPILPGKRIKRIGILRLRGSFALRSTHSAEDDNLSLAKIPPSLIN
jgi:hypothetical protein